MSQVSAFLQNTFPWLPCITEHVQTNIDETSKLC